MAYEIETIGNQTELPLSTAVRAGNFIFCSGQVPIDDAGKVQRGSITSETERVLDALKATLESAGSALDRVVKTTVILTEPSDFEEFNEVYGRYFPNNPPARTTFCAKLLVDARIEIDAIAA
ncbi:RidA family protein [Parasphingorhabdus sp.]|uniref:RidA family protein n=1 Tax=Parasphingorhabdus sp. TaxID=2709688 RepID=UPI0032EF73F7